jgi:hypothetical protein
MADIKKIIDKVGRHPTYFSLKDNVYYSTRQGTVKAVASETSGAERLP